MKRSLALCLFVIALFAVAAPAMAQNPNYDTGPVWRVVYYHVKPGMADAFWKDFKENVKPLLDEFKKQGWISDYKMWTNATADNANDWDIALGLLFPNWAALDQLDAKSASVVTKHYGSREASFDIAKKRAEIRDVVASKLAREVMPK